MATSLLDGGRGRCRSVTLFLVLLPSASGQVCSGQQNFPQAEESEGFIADLTSGVPANATLCPQHWTWFRMPTRFLVPHTQLERSGSAWSQQPRSETMNAGLSVMLDAGYDEVNYRFTTLSFLAVNGTPPSDILRADPYDAAAFASTFHYYSEYTDRETVTFGFNDTLGGSCHSNLADYVFFGVRCQHPLGISPGACVYNLTVTAMPYYLRNGMAFDGYLRPVESAVDEAVRHYFRVALASYELLQIDISRQGDGRPLHDPQTGAPYGIGLAGGVYMQRADPEACPANGSASLLQMCEIGLNDTQPCTVGHACSSPESPTDDLVIMIEAVIGNRPVTYIRPDKSQNEDGCVEVDGVCSYVPNLVDRFGMRPDISAIPDPQNPGPQLPRYNVPWRYIPASLTGWWLPPAADLNKNELRPDRGTYTLRVTQLHYAEGELVQNEQRPGCVGYGQWRHFRITTHGAHDASLTVHAVAQSGRGLGGVYVRQYYPPNELEYSAMTARGVPSSSPQRVSISPCLLNQSTTWFIAVMLEDAATAVSRGVPPTPFVLSVRLEHSVLSMDGGQVVPRGGDDADLPARGLGGDGFACCGVFKYFLVPNVPAHLSLRASLETTLGSARAIFLKARTCPAFPDDVRDEMCTGQCMVSWLTRFDAYDGTPTSTSQTALTIQNGLGAGCPAACPADLRHAGDWYVAVQALPGTEAEFRLVLNVVEPPSVDAGHQCDPDEPECRAPLEGPTQASAAGGGRRRLGAASPAASVLPLAVAVGASAWQCLVAMGAWRRGAHSMPLSSCRLPRL